MGDRANIVVRDNWPSDVRDKEAVFLYTHWAGSELPETLRRGLSAGRDRWDDESYLARIMFQAMIGADTGTTGYGISTQLGDNEYDLLVLHGQRVYLLTESLYKQSGFAELLAQPSASFDEVCDCDASEMTWELLGALASKQEVA